MKVSVYAQRPKLRKVPVSGSLSMDEREAVLLAEDGTLLLKLERPRLTRIGADGFILDGFEHAGMDRQGAKKYRYQEWWVVLEVSK